jgi:hypothetical protein
MKRFTMFACLALALVLALSSFAGEMPRYVISNGNETIIGGGQSFGKAGRDTIELIGPNGLVNGSFQDGSGNANWHDWTHYDITQPTEVHWAASTYFAVSGVYSAWCGLITFPSCVAGDPIGGYGNNWNDMLEWRGTVGNNTLSCTVDVTANLQVDLEIGYDYAYLSCEKFDQPLVDINSWDDAQTIAVAESFSYAPADYMGAGADEVVVLFRVVSDSGASDGDCGWGGSGACQLDDVTITLSNGVGYATDFEDGTLGDFTVRFPQGVGDFAKIWSGLEDFDPCNTNYSAQVAFIDDGIVVPGTGGTPCVNWCYGPSGFIVNTDGGLAGPDSHLFVAVESPVVAWQDLGHNGATLYFDGYAHEDLSDDSPGIFYQWGVRSAVDGDDITTANWEDRNYVYYGTPAYVRTPFPVSDLLVAGRTQIQVQLTCREYGWVWGYIGNDGYPAPYFDNVRFITYPTLGPGMSTRDLQLAQDNFPAFGQVDYVDLGNNSVRFDMANNISPQSHLRNDPGDSVTFSCSVTREGAVLTGNPVMYYKLKPNPLFDAYRTSGTPNEGFVECDSCRNSIGVVVKDAYFADLPDEDFFFPGDIIHYFFTATDDLGGDLQTATLPRDTTGFSIFDDYDPLTYASDFTCRALPTVKSALAGDHPPILFYNDFGARGGQNEWHGALANLGLLAGRDYDVYYTNGPSSSLGNGLGGRATQFHLEGYDVLLYTAGTAGINTISNGDYFNDAANDVGLIDLWLKQGDKNFFLTGDDLANDLEASGAQTLALLEDYLGLSVVSDDLRPLINSQTSPRVLVEGGNPVFNSVSSWIAYGGCAGINTFDAVTPINTATRIAQFANPVGNPGGYPYSAATLNYIAADNANIISMPYDLMFVYTDADEAKALAQLSARARVLQDVLSYFGIDPNPGDVTATDLPGAKFAARAFPNPFNPKTTIAYTAPKAGDMTLKIFNVRGELVKTLIDGPVVAGTSQIVWDGDNNAGAKVSSGVYFYEARMGNDVVVNKMALVK